MIIVEWATFRKRLHLRTAVIVMVGIGSVRFCQLCASPVLTTLYNLCQPQNYLEGRHYSLHFTDDETEI